MRMSAFGTKRTWRKVLTYINACISGLVRANNGEGLMEYPTFRKWLAEHGCRFDTQSERRGAGHGTLVIHRAGRTAELPLVGESHNLDPRSVRQVCEALGLDWSELPGPEGRV